MIQQRWPLRLPFHSSAAERSTNQKNFYFSLINTKNLSVFRNLCYTVPDCKIIGRILSMKKQGFTISLQPIRRFVLYAYCCGLCLSCPSCLYFWTSVISLLSRENIRNLTLRYLLIRCPALPTVTAVIP